MFKVLSLEFFDHSFFGNLVVPFVQIDEINKNNYISFIIGPNGTGKSKILLSLINIMNSLEAASNAPSKKYNFDFPYRLKFENGGEVYDVVYLDDVLMINEMEHNFNIEFVELPSKVLISCFSFNDRYPLREQRGNIMFENYHYLGLKSANNNIFIGNPTKAAINNLYNAIIANKDIAPLKDAFEILDLKPSMTLVYKKGRNFRFLKQWNTIDVKLTPANFAESFRNFINQKTKFADEIRSRAVRYGNEKIENLLNDEQSINEVFYYVDKYFEQLTRSINQELLLRPELNFDSVPSFQVFAEHVSPLKLLSDLEIISFQRFEINKNLDHFSFDDASSGEYHILLTFLNILSILEDNSLVLIDEPEISLHPNWQIRYMDIFNRIFTRFPASHFIIASHSHFLVSDLKGDHSTIVSLKRSKDKSKIEATLKDLNTYSWSAEQVLLEIFELPSTRNFYVSELIGEILSLMADPESENQLIRSKIQRLKDLNLDNLSESDPLKEIVLKLLNKIK